jgi:hypothetical protein
MPTNMTIAAPELYNWNLFSFWNLLIVTHEKIIISENSKQH